MVTRILFVCHGNICRSPMAEFIMKKVIADRGLSEEFCIESCATSNEEIGNDIYPPAKDELRRHGVPFTKRCARRMTSADYDSYDYIVAMDYQNLRNMERFVNGDPAKKVSLMMSHAGEERGVADPWYTDDFSITFDDLYRACTGLLDEITRSREDPRRTRRYRP